MSSERQPGIKGSQEDLRVEYIDPGVLKLPERKLRTHSDLQLKQLARLIKEYGFLVPPLVDRNNVLRIGLGRVRAAVLVGLKNIPIIRVEHLTEAQIRAFAIADNKLVENARWDWKELALEFSDLKGLGIDLEITGFEMGEIDLVLEEHGGQGDETEDDVPKTPEVSTSQLGDLWRLGDNYLLCADALKPESYARLLDGKLADTVFADPPFNVRIRGHVSGKGNAKHREFVMASGEMSSDEYRRFLDTAHANIGQHMAPGAVAFMCIDWRHVGPLMESLECASFTPLNLCVWVKPNGGMGSLYRSRHELIVVARHGEGPHTNNVQLGRTGRYRTNVWEYAGVNSFREGRKAELAMHPTVKPVALVSDALKDCSKRGDSALDPFCGSGTTIIAGEKTGRRVYGMELDPIYVDVALRRWEKYSGGTAIHVETGSTFETLRAERGSVSWRRQAWDLRGRSKCSG